MGTVTLKEGRESQLKGGVPSLQDRKRTKRVVGIHKATMEEFHNRGETRHITEAE